MFYRLVFAFIAIPLMELYLLLQVGGYLGAWPTIGLVIATGIAGASLAKRQGMSVMARIHQNTANGVVPTEELQDGLLILVAGVVLITPGLLTDVAGLLLLIPWTRNMAKQWLRKKFEQSASKHSVVIDVTPR
ncbi:MAG: FxsA family protein [Desulfovibrio sp.]|nr:MAG: FxsA family protein [Desulfovibrio sp.]